MGARVEMVLNPGVVEGDVLGRGWSESDLLDPITMPIFLDLLEQEASRAVWKCCPVVRCTMELNQRKGERARGTRAE